MAIYETKVDQNIFDISVQLYGSIEGAFDLLISNPGLSVNDDIPRGTKLNYHDYFVINQDIANTMQQSPPSSIPHHIYYKAPPTPCTMIIIVPSSLDSGLINVSGDGEMIIDWGDNTDLETISLSSEYKEFIHYYNNTLHTSYREIRIYGKYNIQRIDITDLNGEFYPLREVVVDELVCNSYTGNLWGVMLFKGINVLQLRKCVISTMAPLYDLDLQILDLSNSIIEESEFEEYLKYITTHYGNRRNCTVTAHVPVTSEALQYIKTIIQNPDWNLNGQWSFNINGIIYDDSYEWTDNQ